MKKIVKRILIVVGILAIVGIGGCVASLAFVGNEVNNEIEKANKVEKVDSTGSSTKSSSEEQTTFKEGETFKLDGLEVTVDSAKFVPAADEYNTPQKGKVLEVTVTAKNASDSNKTISNIDWNISDSSGSTHDYYYGYNDMNLDSEIRPGKSFTGKVYYDVPESDSYELAYTPSFSLSSTEVIIQLSKQDLAK